MTSRDTGGVRRSVSRNRRKCTTLSLAYLSTDTPLDRRYKRGRKREGMQAAACNTVAASLVGEQCVWIFWPYDSGGLATVLSPQRLPLPLTLAAESRRPSCYNPIMMSWRASAAAQYNHVVSIMRDTMDTMLFVRRRAHRQRTCGKEREP